MTDKRIIVVITDEDDEGIYQLIKSINIDGYPDAFELEGDRMQALFEAMGYEGIPAEEIDTGEHDMRLNKIAKLLDSGVRETDTRMLASIAWALTDIAKTHARSMPSVV